MSAIKPKIIKIRIKKKKKETPLNFPVIENETIQKNPNKKFKINIKDPYPIYNVPPCRISIEYSHDFNILNIHDTIYYKYCCLLGNLKGMKSALKVLILSKKNCSTIIDSKHYEKKINKLKEEINQISNLSEWNSYISEALPILQKYLPLASASSRGVFYISKKINRNDQHLISRLEVIEEYLNIAKKYIEINSRLIIENNVLCPSCGETLNSSQNCNCGLVFDRIELQTTQKDWVKNPNKNKIFNDLKNFTEVLDRYQGISNENIPDELFEQLDAVCLNLNLKTGEQIRKLPTLRNGKKFGTSVSLLENLLKESSNSSYYPLIYPLVYIYWGWRRPNISNIREQILQKYVEMQEFYYSNGGTKTSLNKNLHLFQILKHFQHDCKKTDFKIPTSPSSIEKHRTHFKKMSTKIDFKYTKF